MDLDQLYLEFLQSDGVSIDSRILKPNQLFFALPGSQVNGNAFALAALKAGARLAIVEDPALAGANDRCIYASSSLGLLQALAKHHREQFKIPVIGITGSVGKTTTKELIASILSTRYHTVATQGNLNNHIGVPLTILNINKNTELAIIEMGANHIGEIAELCEICQPTHGLITRIGKAHLEGFGSLEGVIIAKSDLYRYLRDHAGMVFVQDSDDLVLAVSKGFEMNKIFVQQMVKGSILQSDPFLQLEVVVSGESFLIQTKLPGQYNFDNIMMGIAVGIYFEVPFSLIRKAIESYALSSNRSQHIYSGTNEFILDAYNANPLSMAEAIKSFQSWNTNKKKILVLGEMKELGDSRLAEHQKILELIDEYPWDKICLVGPSFPEAGADQDYIFFNDVDALKTWYLKQDFKDTAFLIKASRSMALEKMIDHINPGSGH
jgi:UDP-N-acetylmuramoyl-tripeptide--D-alanyl-D-alanine ligase